MSRFCARSVVFIAIGVRALRAADNPPQSITIEQAVAEAVRNNPDLLAERLGIPVAETALITAGLRPNPVLSASSDHLDWLGTGFSDANGAGPTEHAVRVDLPVERGNKRDHRIDTAGYGTKIAEAHISDFLRKLKLDVTLACIDVIDAKSRLDLANDNLKSLQGIVQINESRLQGGAIAPVELTRSRVAMLQFRASVKSAELTLTSARIKLQALLGRTPGQGIVDISDSLKTTLPPPPDLATLEAAALATRPDLQAVRLDQARSQAELRLQLAEGKVDYSVGMEYRRQQGVNGRGNSLGFFVSVPLPLFNRNQGEIARAANEEQQLRKQLEALQAQVNSEVVGAYREYENTLELMTEIESDLLAPSQEARDTTAYVYRAGASSLVEVLDAQRAFNDTMSTYYGAQADYRRAISRLQAVAGQDAGSPGVKP